MDMNRWKPEDVRQSIFNMEVRMKKNLIAAIAGTMAFCIMAAGCSSQTGTAPAGGADAAATAATAAAAATAATAAAAVEEAPAWQDLDDSYLSGITASDYVELPDDYKHLKVEAAKPEEATDEEVEERIQNSLQSNAPLEEVDRKVEEGDSVNIDFVGKLDGEEFEGGSGTYDLVIGSHSFIEGFEEGLIGAKKGETRDLELTFPEDYSAANLAGKDVVFTVTVNKISEYKVPELNDEYVRSLNVTNAFGNAVTTVDDYRDYIRSNINEERESSYRSTVLAAGLTKLQEQSTFKEGIPANMSDQYYDSETRMLQYYALMNYMELKDLMINVYQATEDNYLQMIRDMADSQMKRDIILQAIADERDLNPSEEEVTEAIAQYVESEETIEKPEDVGRYAREFLRDELLRKNVYDWLFEHIEAEEPSEEEAEAAATGETSSETAATDGTAAAEEENKDDSEESSDTATGEAAEESGEGNTGSAASTEEKAEEEDKDN